MNIEIERKYLLRNEDWRGLAEGVYYKQAYLNERGGNTVRVRIEGEKAKLTIKGKAKNISRVRNKQFLPTAKSAMIKITWR